MSINDMLRGGGTVTRDASTIGGEYWRTRTPAPRLRRWVSFYLAFRRVAPVPEVRTVAAVNSIVVIIDLDPPNRRRLTGTSQVTLSPVTGLSSQPLSYERTGTERAIVIELTPLGARALLGLPLREIADTSVGFDDLLGHRARDLTEELQLASDTDHRFRILDRRLSGWLLDEPQLTKALDMSWRHLTVRDEGVRIHDLADRTGLSRQHLSKVFHREIGLPPKIVGRIARCHRAIRLLTGRNPPSLAALANLCGYTDHAHLDRDFRLLIGTTPTALLRPHNTTDLYVGSLISMRPTPLTGTKLELGFPLSWRG
ncbi:helix-turn-helix domain-containing protein [Amycolatopsis japonica]|uniref:AraC family transcriptional regulator n=1 Tax=Amycolatopsis japonica TaxID=208439 RepID=UPI00366F1952